MSRGPAVSETRSASRWSVADGVAQAIDRDTAAEAPDGLACDRCPPVVGTAVGFTGGRRIGSR